MFLLIRLFLSGLEQYGKEKKIQKTLSGCHDLNSDLG